MIRELLFFSVTIVVTCGFLRNHGVFRKGNIKRENDTSERHVTIQLTDCALILVIIPPSVMGTKLNTFLCNDEYQKNKYINDAVNRVMMRIYVPDLCSLDYRL